MTPKLQFGGKTNFVDVFIEKTKMDSGFARVQSIIQRMRDVLKCQKCLELKKQDSMLFYRMCDHFFCVDCVGDNKSCELCSNPFDKSTIVADDKNILSLFQSLVNFELPSREEVERIYENHKKSKEITEEEKPKNEVKETPKSGLRKRTRSGAAGKTNAENVKDVTPRGRKNAKLKVEEGNVKLKVEGENVKLKVEGENVKLKVEGENVKNVTPRGRKVEVGNVTPIENKKQTPLRSGRNVTPAVKNTTPASVTSAGSNKTSASKVNINKRNPKGETQLHIACKKSNFTAIEELIAAGANPNAQDNAGWTPLHESVFSGNLEVIKFLLDHGAKVNAPGLENTTALHEAIAKGNTNIVKLLLEYGADIKAMNMFRETPLDLVTKYKLAEMKEILEASSVDKKTNPEVEPMEEDQKISVYKHNLAVEDEKSVNKFVEKFNLDLVSSVTLKTPPTHIVVANERFEVTWAVISSVPAGCWIVTVDWVKDSMEANSIKPASSYEPSKTFFSGFAKARANKLQQLPGLFSGCHFFFGGNFSHYAMKNVTIGKEELKALVEKLGGATLKRSPDPESLALEKTVPFHAARESSLCDTSYFIVYQADKWDPKPKYNMSHMKTLPVDWLVACLFKFELVDPKGKEPPFCDFL